MKFKSITKNLLCVTCLMCIMAALSAGCAPEEGDLWTAQLDGTSAEEEAVTDVDAAIELEEAISESRWVKSAVSPPTAGEIAALRRYLSDVDPSKYALIIATDGRDEVRMGNAAIRDLRTVKVIHAPGSRPSVAKEIITTVGDYIRIIWTSHLGSVDEAKVARVNALLDRIATPEE